jgi:hypothetical protein
MNWRVRRWLGHLVECSDERGVEQLVGLENLFRRVRREERERWPALIGEFLTTVGSAEPGTLLPSDLESAAEQLMVRLGPPFPPRARDVNVWSQAIANTGLTINLVIDHRSQMCYVSEKLVADSGRPGEMWLEKAIENLSARTPAECLQLLDPETGIQMCAVGDAYDSSRVLILDRLIPSGSPHGFFVALPNRDQLLVLPVTQGGLKSLHFVKIVAEKNFRTAPHPISSEVYWLRDQIWRPIGIQIQDCEVTVSPPPEFGEVLAQIGGETDQHGASETPAN